MNMKKLVSALLAALMLVGIGLCYLDIGKVINSFTIQYLIMCLVTCLGAFFGAAIVGKFVGFFRERMSPFPRATRNTNILHLLIFLSRWMQTALKTVTSSTPLTIPKIPTHGSACRKTAAGFRK